MTTKVLVVDDSAFSRRVLREILQFENFEVVEAENGARAIECYVADRPDVVLLDLLMPGLDGFEIMKKLLEKDPSARIVIVTADVQRSSHEMAQAAGACGFVEKPYEARQIIDAVTSVMAGGKVWS